MIDTAGLAQELIDAGQAIGLISDDRSLNADWFGSPLTHLEQMLTTPSQRAALLRALEGLLPADGAAAGAPAGERWHPLFDAGHDGNVFLVITGDGTGPVVIGAAASVAGPSENLGDPTKPSARLSIRAPLVKADGGALTALAGTSEGPISAELRVNLHLQRGTGVGQSPIGLQALRIAVLSGTGATPVRVRVTMEELDLGDGAGPVAEVVLDPDQLGSEAAHVAVGLLRQAFHSASSLDPAGQSLVQSLPGLLGLLNDGIPPFPFADLLHNPQGLRAWLRSLTAGGAGAPAVKWLGHLAALFGISTPAVTGIGAATDPWRVSILAIGTGGLEAVLAIDRDPATGVDVLLPGLAVRLPSAVAGSKAVLKAGATVAAVPLSGVVPAVPLPRAKLLIEAPGTGPLIAPGGAIAIGQVRAGLTWDGARGRLTPLLELDAVDFEGTHHDRIDLSNAQALTQAAQNVLQTALQHVLGTTGAGRSLGALAGLVPPTGHASWPSANLADPGRLAASPLAEISRVHRAVLATAAPNDWGAMLGEIGALAGLAGAPSGSGTPDDAWRIAIDGSGSLGVSLAAWNDASGGTDRLRLGLRVGADQGPIHGSWQLSVAGFDLPAGGRATAHFLGSHRLAASLQPVPALPSVSGVQLEAQAFHAALDWAAGGPARCTADVSGVRVTAEGTTLNVGTISFPAGAGTPANPLGGLGVAPAAAEQVARVLAARAAAAWGGLPAQGLGALAGVHRGLPGLPAEWPLLGDPAQPGALFEHPVAALRDWLRRLVETVAADGTPLAVAWARYAALLLEGAFTSPVLPAGPPIRGSGTAADPWTVPLGNGDPNLPGADGLVWLEPGPPHAWLAAAAARLMAAVTFDELLAGAAAGGRFLPQLAAALQAADLAAAGAGLAGLASYLAGSDGVVPQASQLPTAAGWQPGATPLHSPHHLHPQDPAAIAQIQTALAGFGGADPVVLVSPPFGASGDWAALLAAAGAAADPAAHFDFRQPGVPPSAVDLTTVTATSRFYTCDLADTGAGRLDAMTIQVTRALARVRELHGGGKVALVGHSVAGLAALAAVQSAPAGAVAGLVTLGAPLAGSPLTPILDSGVAGAVRLLRRLAPSGLADANLEGALDHLARALDGFLPPPNPSTPSVAAPYPVPAFAAPASLRLPASVTAVALGGSLAGDLRNEVRTVLAAAVAAVPAPGPGDTGPTHAGIALRLRLLAGGTVGEPTVDAGVRLDLGRVRLSSTPDVTAFRPRVSVDVKLFGSDGWLVGDPGSADARVRWAELGLTIEPPAAPGGHILLTPRAVLHDSAIRQPLVGDVSLGQAGFPELLGSALRALSSPAPDPGSPVAVLLAALSALGLAAPDGHGGVGVAADALAALAADAQGFLGARLRAALDGGTLLGLTGPPGGPWNLPAAALPLNLGLTTSPAGVHISTPGAGLDLGGIRLSSDFRLNLPDLAPQISATLAAGPVTLTLTQPGGHLVLDAAPWVAALTLLPAGSGAAQQAAALSLIPRLALSSAVSAVIESLVGPALRIGPIDALLAGPGAWAQRPGALGAGGGGGGFDGGRIATLLTTIGAAAGLPAAPGGGVLLPGHVAVKVSGGDPLVIEAATTAAIGGALDLQLTISIDRALHVAPAGKATLHANLAPGAAWGTVAVIAEATPSGLGLSLQPGIGAHLTLLPQLSGLDTLLASLTGALLPAVLDATVGTAAVQASPITPVCLQLTSALGLSDPTGNFAGHAAAWAQVGQPGWLEARAAGARQAAIQALAHLLGDPGLPFSIPGVAVAPDAAGTAARWQFTPTGAGFGGHVVVTAGWDAGGPTARLGVENLTLGGSALHVDGSLGYSSGAVALSLTGSVAAPAGLGLEFQPALTASLNAGKLAVRFLPLGVGSDGDLAIDLAPSAGIHPATPNLVALAEKWLLPALGDAALAAAGDTLLQRTPWQGGPTLAALLQTAGVLAAGGPPFSLASPLPAAGDLPLRALAAAAGYQVQVTPTLKISLVNDAGQPYARVGARLTGYLELPAGAVSVRTLFGGPNGMPGSDSGVTLYLAEVTGGSPGLRLRPSLHVVGAGVGVAGSGDSPLVNTNGFRLGGVEGYLYFDLDLVDGGGNPQLSVRNSGAGFELSELGLPLNAIGGAGGSNPVAQSLLAGGPGGGGGAPPGDGQPVNPSVSVSVYDRGGTITFLIKGSRKISIPIHQAFGPLHIEQVDLEVDNASTRMAVLLVGGLKMSGFQVEVIDLGVDVPFATFLHPDTWALDLRGLAASLEAPGVSIAGGLLKNDRPPVEYDGMLTAHLAGIGGITVVGSYARPADYTSLFVFVALDIPLGGPPFLFILGLGAGVGVNRELHVPDDVGRIQNFLLVQAIDDNSLANDPMAALIQMGAAMPPRRGSFWLAAGLRFSTFALVTTTAVIYVELNNGVEVGLLGVSRMALPVGQLALISVELALKARFSSAEGLLSVQAQLTDNSWLFYSDCQLTGGFAFFMWFRKAQFLLTLGGYHPAFQAPSGFPSVPRLGFHWQVSSLIVVKGEAYFALTTSCVMAGGRLEAVFDAGAIRAWFEAHADLLISWDPFVYDIEVGISVGVSAHVRVCFFACADIGITVSVGADLHILGPPFHGSVRVEYWVVSVTIPFGPDPQKPPPLSWPQFRDKYLVSGDPAGTAVDVRPLAGLLPQDPPGAQPAPGTEAQPWRMQPEWVFETGTRVAGGTALDVAARSTIAPAELGAIDLAPMGHEFGGIASVHSLSVEVRQPNGSWVAIPVASSAVTTEVLISDFPEATWHYTDPNHPIAAARTIRGISGLRVTGHPSLPGQTADIHIAVLVDDLVWKARPLPLDPGPEVVGILHGFGAGAESLALISASATAEVLVEAAQKVLSGPLLAAPRADLGFAAQGLQPMAVRALRQNRSAPPQLLPLSAGLTMKPPPLPPPPPIQRPADVTSIPLAGARLRAVLGSRPRPADPAPIRARTTVSGLAAAAGMVRTAPPQAQVLAGARLIRVPAPDASRPTDLAAAGRWLRSAQVGTQVSALAARRLAQTEAAFAAEGAGVAAGETQVWDLPAGPARLELSPGSVARITFLDHAGAVLQDEEGPSGQGGWLPVPDTAAAVVVACLGDLAGLGGVQVGPGPGVVSSAIAPPGGVAATGWQLGEMLPQVGAGTVLCRGGWVSLSRPPRVRRDRTPTSQAMVRMGSATADTAGVQTWLPAATSVVMILLDQQDPTAALDGDLAIAFSGGTLASVPVRVGGGRRLALLYDVTAVEPGVRQIAVSVASAAGWRQAGVVGLGGRAVEWAVRMHGEVPEQLVPEGPLTPDGAVTVRWVSTGPPTQSQGGPQ